MNGAEDLLLAVALLLIGGSIVVSGVTGKLYGRGGPPWMDREEDPVAFWWFWGIGVAFYCLFVWYFFFGR